MPGNIIILHKSTINDDYMMYGYEARQTKLLVVLGNLLPFYHTNNTKNQNSEKMSKKKKNLKVSSFYTSVLKIMIICYTVPKILHVTDVIVIFHFGLFFPFYNVTA